jgi:pimeloyl-ACP methyl ester carboxylesterase
MYGQLQRGHYERAPSPVGGTDIWNLGSDGSLEFRGNGRRGPPKLVTESALIPSADTGIQLYLREKRPADLTRFHSDRVLLFVHGATYPAETSFDLPLGGVSMMEWIAQRGWDVWLVDVRGYGGSTRPPEMDRPAQENKPIVDTATAARDVGATVGHIMQKRGVPKINLMGWSWGTSIMGSYTAEHNDQVARLVLYAPQWISNSPSPVDAGGALVPTVPLRSTAPKSAG